jgi:hypothetical protein
MPSEQNNIGPNMKKGISQTVRVMCASNKKIPTAVINKNEITAKTI